MPAKSKSSTLADFQNLLRQMFHIDATELNFGIYRVIRQRSAMIESKLIAAMPEICADVLSQITDDKNEAAQNDVWAVKEKVHNTMGADAIDKDGNLLAGYANTPLGQEYKAARIRARIAFTTPKETDIFNHLLQFFGYYYSNGDFVPSRRITNRGVYSLPYNGEDVMLHWANRGQYYVKTTERFLSYAFVTGTTKVRFIVEEALNLPENNNKGARKFFFPQPDQATVRDGEFTIPFQYRAAMPEDKLSTKNGKGQDEINSRAEECAHKLWDKKLSASAKKDLLHAEKDAKSPWLQALESYTRGNNSDFFIHKDLEVFLRNELKAYLTNHILDLDEITQTDIARGEAQLLLARAVRDVAHRVIQFLTQLENFQKILWEKRKFITQTNYIVRWGAVLEHCDDAKTDVLTATIVDCKEQWEEWQELGFLESITDIFAKGEKSITARKAFLRDHLSVPLDTRYFNEAFIMDVLACFDDIDEATDGVLMHSENWQALNLLSGKYAGKVKCVYIDPPYNTDASAILYKNDYKHSSWLSLMHDRIALSQSVLTSGGVLCCAIDDVEVGPLRAVMEMIFPKEVGIAPVRSNPAGRKSSGQFSPAHEYAIFYGDEESVPGVLKKTEKQIGRYPKTDEKGHFAWANFVRSGADDRREDRPKLFYPMFVNDKNEIRIPKMEWDEGSRAWVLQESARKNDTVVYPFRENGNGKFEGHWQRSHQRVIDEPKEFSIHRLADNKISIHFKTYMDENSMPITWWGEKEYASANHGAGGLKKLFGMGNFDFPKSVKLVEDCLRASGIDSNKSAIALDFFAGSGTTAHAIINLNREDGKQRKFILVEMGEYFETILTPRIKKIIFTPDWKDGKPAPQNGGDLFPKEVTARAPRIVKYHRMESYEDALDNIQFDADDSLFDDDYEYRYMLQWESRQCATFAPGGKIDNPFSYTLKRAGKEHLARADLPETFNAMAGFHLQQRRIVMNGTIKYQIDLGILDGKKTALIWRDIAGWQDADKRKDHLFVAELGKQKWLSGAQTYVNGDSDIGQTKSLSPKFHDLMFAKVE